MSDTRKRPAGLRGEDYAGSIPPRRSRRARQAASFRHDERMERLDALCESDPTAFGRLGPTEKVGIGYYLSARTAHEEEQEHDDGNG